MSKSVRILIIDDEEVVILAVQKILSHDKLFDYVFDFAYSAEEGLEKAISNHYDVIISDIVMPGMDGMELLQKIKDRNIKAQVIMFTGYATMKSALLALKMGAFDFIAKPFTSEELCSSLHRALRAGDKKKNNSENGLQDKNVIKPFYVYAIPGQTWAIIQEDYSVYIGLEKDFINGIDEIEKLELLDKGDRIVQGQGFGKITTKSESIHRLLSPFSGRVLAVNQLILDNTTLLYDYPRLDGWLIHMEPTEIEKEVSNLVSSK